MPGKRYAAVTVAALLSLASALPAASPTLASPAPASPTLASPTVASPTIRVSNPTDQAWNEVPVVLAWTASFEQAWQAGRRVLTGKQPVAFQRDDLNGDGRIDELVFLVNLGPRETQEFHFAGEGVAPVSPPRAHAGMYLRGLVGPAWESDVIAYRTYWLPVSPIDIFGKTSPMLSLKAYASGEFNYHVESKYGMDVLKVGPALGVGGFGAFVDGEIWQVKDAMRTHFVRADGPLRAVLELQFIDWYFGPGEKKPGESGPGIQRRCDLYVWMSIIAGQKWAQADLYVKPVDKGPAPELVTGVVKHEETELIHHQDLGIVGRWGRQALGDLEVPKSGDLGLAVIVDPKDVIAYGEDAYSNYARLRPTDGRVRYWYHGSWFKEPDGARSTADYDRMLREVVARRPIVEVNPNVAYRNAGEVRIEK